jgi:uncharacterized protein (DUF924 family)
MANHAVEDIIDYWLGSASHSTENIDAERERWYRGGDVVDDEIRSRFGAYLRRACDGVLLPWRHTSRGSLALVILLDQFTRNVFRGTVQAYAGDNMAWQVADAAVLSGFDAELPVYGRIFLYHPFHHSEEIDQQNRGVALVEGMVSTVDETWRPYVQRTVEGFGRHRDIVARFGRFPHRNAVLGRDSTPEEAEFLADDPNAYGQR